MSEHIQDFEKIYICDYLNERKEEIFNLLKKYEISYFKIDSGRDIFFDKDDKIILRAFYASSEKYVSIDEYKNERLYSKCGGERIKLIFDKLNSYDLWTKGAYFKFIVDSILNLEDLPIKVR